MRYKIAVKYDTLHAVRSLVCCSCAKLYVRLLDA